VKSVVDTIRNRNVYVLGAGFSTDAGAPVMANFLQNAREWYESPHSHIQPSIQKHYSKVFQFRQRAKQCRDSLNIDLENIEELFGLADVTSIAGDAKGAPSASIKHLIADTVSRFGPNGRMLSVRIRAHDVEKLPRPRLLQPFFKSEDDLQSTYELTQYEFFAALLLGFFDPKEACVDDAVVTFNYDTVLEQALWSIGGQVDHLVKRTKKVGSNISSIKRARLPVAKLHGSSNWAYVAKKSVRAHLYDSYHDFYNKHEPIVVPPTWKKGELSPLLGEVWQRAHEYLSKATRICVIGYSMPLTDLFFHHLIASSLSENPGLYGFHVVDQSADTYENEVDVRYRSRFDPLVRYGKYHFFGGGLTNFLNPHHLGQIGRGKLIYMIEHRF
jgi:hypothetical protein